MDKRIEEVEADKAAEHMKLILTALALRQPTCPCGCGGATAITLTREELRAAVDMAGDGSVFWQMDGATGIMRIGVASIDTLRALASGGPKPDLH